MPVSVTAGALQDVIPALRSSPRCASLKEQARWLLSEGGEQLLSAGFSVLGFFGVFVFAQGCWRKAFSSSMNWVLFAAR